MKIREGFVTNSSSTNFIIISKKVLTVEYLYKKLGFLPNSPIKTEGMELCENIIQGIENGTRWFTIDVNDPHQIEKKFGQKAAEKFKGFSKNSQCFVYAGATSSDETTLTSFFTMDSFEIEEKDFYLNGRNCVW